VGDRLGLFYPLLQLGVVARLAGDYTRAAALVEESLALARPLEHKQNIALCLMRIGGVAGAVGQGARRAALEAAETLFNTIGLSITTLPGLPAAYDRYVVAARAQLDEATFAAAWAAGCALSLDQAVGEALEH